MIRNPTPAFISLITAFAIAFLGSLAALGITGQLSVSLFLFGVLALNSFIVTYFTLELFIYRKIKLIYKTIHDVKSHKKETFFRKVNIEADPLGEVQMEVNEWVSDSTQQIADLQKQETFRREFLGNVSHELKTPIFNLQGYIHTLLDGALHDPEVNVKFLQKAANSADHMSALVQDLVNISKLESGEIILEFERFDIHALVQDVYEQLEVRAKQRKITLRIKEGCDKPFWVNADKSKVRQVLVNLIINAIQYGKEAGTIALSFYDMAEHILTEVADDGDGIDKEHLPRLFERFYRVDKSRSRDEGGTGLGLAIVKHMIDAQGQTVTVRSTKGKGTTFNFTLQKTGSSLMG